ncbi:MAG: hypothetical protein RBR41_05530 [Desulfovibrio sp.]|uniref:hypothetical protein n=1 Tax=Desulfovibrio sp. TaxID=885 RepID=UPI002A367C5F|nr:hypothetical protein [Desulfovibrio sp.]MDY0259110.1 hypothetical protein [Desulfovibrio sp.]
MGSQPFQRLAVQKVRVLGGGGVGEETLLQKGPSPTKHFTVKRHLQHLTLEMLAYGRQKPAFSHFVARIFKKILAEQLTHFIRYLL